MPATTLSRLTPWFALLSVRVKTSDIILDVSHNPDLCAHRHSIVMLKLYNRFSHRGTR